LALVVHIGRFIHQLDISNAFLHGLLEEEVFMEKPKGFEDPQLPDHVCRLHKSLYGSKQAPQAWFMRLSQALLDLHFEGSVVDASLFYFHCSLVTMFVLIYVDDILVTSNSYSAISHLITQLHCEFPVKDLIPLSYFLGIQAKKGDQELFLSQTKYIIDLLQRTKMEDSKPASTPCASREKLSRFIGDPLADPTAYHHVVGALQYCTLTQLDIAYIVNQLCQFLHAPTSAHLILTEHGVQMTESLQQATTFILVHDSFPGLLRSKRLWPGLALRLSIGPWHLLMSKCIGFTCYSRSYGFLFSPPILYFMPGPNTLKWITTASEKKFSTRISMLSISQLIINLHISSPKVCLQLGFFS
jgi:hypothetical protein